MTNNLSYFLTYRNVSEDQRQVRGIGGSMLTVIGVEDIDIKILHNHGHTLGTLKGVIHVTLLSCNLFSSYVAVQRKIYTLHTDTGCEMLENGQVVMIGNIHNRMYRLNIKVVPRLATVLAATSATSFAVPTIV